jgi:hypothetical protein
MYQNFCGFIAFMAFMSAILPKKTVATVKCVAQQLIANLKLASLSVSGCGLFNPQFFFK